MARLLTLLLFLLLTACAGSVSVDGDADSFGPGTSSAYLVVDLDGDTYHAFLLSNKGGLCGKLQAGFDKAYDATDEWLDGDTGDDERCDAYVDGLADAWDPLTRGSANVIGVQVNSFALSLDEVTEPDSDTYDAGDGEAIMTVSYFPSGSSVYALAAEQGGGCEELDDMLEDADDDVDTLWADDGDITLEETDSGAWRLDFEVELDDEDGDPSGDIAGGFGASTCDVELDSLSALELLSSPWAYAPWRF